MLDKGEIVEQGTHEELLEKQGEYYRLWEMQQGNFELRDECQEEKTVSDAVEEDSEGVMSYT